jgi:hypothetical protein
MSSAVGGAKGASDVDIFAPRVRVRNVPYTSLYGCESRSEFVAVDRLRHVRIESRWHETAGAVDEKFPYLVLNAVEGMPENEVLILPAAMARDRRPSAGSAARQARSTASGFSPPM